MVVVFVVALAAVALAALATVSWTRTRRRSRNEKQRGMLKKMKIEAVAAIPDDAADAGSTGVAPFVAEADNTFSTTFASVP